MSIQTELTRITNAKDAIKTAIEGKGVTVPSGTLLDGMAALIESIEAGGGSGGDVDLSDMTFCRFEYVTPAENITSWLSLDFWPPNSNIFAIGIASTNGISLESGAIQAGLYVSDGWAIRLCSTDKPESGIVPYIFQQQVKFNKTRYLQAGVTHKYVIVGK